jgi:hypothetical protein
MDRRCSSASPPTPSSGSSSAGQGLLRFGAKSYVLTSSGDKIDNG